jgi:hypothetical protein
MLKASEPTLKASEPTLKTSKTRCSNAQGTIPIKLWNKLVKSVSFGLIGLGKSVALMSGDQKTQCGLPGKVGTKASSSDVINSPSHYNVCGFEAIDMIDALVAQYPDPVEAYRIGSLWKYVYRAPHKGAKIQDLKKGRWFLNKLIEIEEAKRLNSVSMLEAFHSAPQMVTETDSILND